MLRLPTRRFALLTIVLCLAGLLSPATTPLRAQRVFSGAPATDSRPATLRASLLALLAHNASPFALSPAQLNPFTTSSAFALGPCAITVIAPDSLALVTTGQHYDWSSAGVGPYFFTAPLETRSPDTLRAKLSGVGCQSSSPRNVRLVLEIPDLMFVVEPPSASTLYSWLVTGDDTMAPLPGRTGLYAVMPGGSLEDLHVALSNDTLRIEGAGRYRDSLTIALRAKHDSTVAAERAEAAAEARHAAAARSARARLIRSQHWSPAVTKAVLEGRVRVGTTERQVRLAWGDPESVHVTQTSLGVRKQYVYGLGQYVYFGDGVVTAVSTIH